MDIDPVYTDLARILQRLQKLTTEESWQTIWPRQDELFREAFLAVKDRLPTDYQELVDAIVKTYDELNVLEEHLRENEGE